MSHQKLLLGEINPFRNLNVVNDDVLCVWLPLITQINSSQKEFKNVRVVSRSRCWKFYREGCVSVEPYIGHA